MAVVKRRKKTTAAGRIRLAHQYLLRDKIPPPEANEFVVFDFHREAEAQWREHSETILAEWVSEQPGTRPLCWWLYSCPVAVPKYMGIDVGQFVHTWAVEPKHAAPTLKQRDFLTKHGLLTEGE